MKISVTFVILVTVVVHVRCQAAKPEEKKDEKRSTGTSATPIAAAVTAAKVEVKRDVASGTPTAALPTVGNPATSSDPTTKKKKKKKRKISEASPKDDGIIEKRSTSENVPVNSLTVVPEKEKRSAVNVASVSSIGGASPAQSAPKALEAPAASSSKLTAASSPSSTTPTAAASSAAASSVSSASSASSPSASSSNSLAADVSANSDVKRDVPAATPVAVQEPVLTVSVDSQTPQQVQKRADDGDASGLGSKADELIEKIYEEEKDMKILMKTIVREEKQMEKMLHKLEILEKRVEAQTKPKDPRPKFHPRHRQS